MLLLAARQHLSLSFFSILGCWLDLPERDEVFLSLSLHLHLKHNVSRGWIEEWRSEDEDENKVVKCDAPPPPLLTMFAASFLSMCVCV